MFCYTALAKMSLSWDQDQFMELFVGSSLGEKIKKKCWLTVVKLFFMIRAVKYKMVKVLLSDGQLLFGLKKDQIAGELGQKKGCLLEGIEFLKEPKYVL